jgi:alpha,alpha-trehalose phosphorylase
MKKKIISNEELLINETLLSTANGYVGIRGNFEEAYPQEFDSIRGTYINGFYDIVDITYGESAYGFPKTAQKIVNVMDAQSISLTFDDEVFSVFEGQVLDLKRELDIKKGIAKRFIHWISPKGKELKISFTRLVSFVQLELCLIQVRVESINYNGPMKISSCLKGNVSNYTDPNDPRVASGHADLLEIVHTYSSDNIMQLTAKTKRSFKEVTCTVSHSMHMDISLNDNKYTGESQEDLKAGQSLAFTKYMVYTDTIRHESCSNKGIEIMKDAMTKTMEQWKQEQASYLDEFWKYSEIQVTDSLEIQEALNYSAYQLLASAGKDPHCNISAKGLSGEGYEGHYFWDTEVYMMPFFTLTNPVIAKNLLKFRYETLDDSRARAIEMGHRYGAKIPWRTIAGTECSGYFPAGSAQYHINADVAYSNIQYYLFSQDLQYILDYGFEVIAETARIWLDMGHYSKEGKFMIHDVTGPDEYSAIVNNNYYTNVLAQYHLNWTVKFADLLGEKYKEFSDILKRLNLSKEELNAMDKAAQAMFLPFDQERNMVLQDDSFITKPVWDFAATPKEKYPLLLHYHPLTIYRHQVLKQADAILAMVLLDNVSEEVLANSYAYYEPLTTHDSSLSPCVYSIAASRMKKSETAYEFFMKTLRLDLDNLHHNTKDGLHIANAGGAYMTAIYGFGGLRIKEKGLCFYPCLPKEISRLTFRLNHQGGLIKVTLGNNLVIEVESPLDIYVFDQVYHVDTILEVKL